MKKMLLGLRVLGICLALIQTNSGAGRSEDGTKYSSVDARVDHLLAQMSFGEKMALIRGATEDAATSQAQAGYIAGVARLSIPPRRLADGPPGILTRLPSQAETATMGLAATFSMADAQANGNVIAREAKSLGIDIALQPYINIDRDITTSRAYNTYGEDPLLTGQIGAGLVEGIQSLGVMAQAKHYVGYDTEGNDVVIGLQALHEIYLAPFAAVVNAGVSSIMCSYNKINGEHACGNQDLLTKVLRNELEFRGFVTSDWGAVHAPDYINAGLDMEMPGITSPKSPFAPMMFSYFDTDKPSKPSSATIDPAMIAGFMGSNMPEESQAGETAMPGVGEVDPRRDFWNLRAEGRLPVSAVDRAARRVLYEIARFGYLDHPPSHRILPHATALNAAVIEKTALDAAVLLKNDGHTLPLRRDMLNDVVFIGPGAGQVVAVGMAGERSVGFSWRQVGPVDAIKKLVPGASPRYAVEDDMTGSAIPAQYLSHNGVPGLIRRDVAGTRIDRDVDFTRQSGQSLPANYAAHWTGTLNITKPGEYWIYLQLLGAGGDLSIDGKKLASAGLRGVFHGDTVLAGKDGMLPTTDGLDNLRVAVKLTAGPHAIDLHSFGDTSGQNEQIRLAWMTPEEREADHDAAIAAARTAKIAVVFVWSRGRPDFRLPGDQDALIRDIAAVNPNTVVVMNVSEPVTMPWLDSVKSVLQMWWPGDEGGWATAKLLMGDVSPAGRLPFTWAHKLDDYAATDPDHPERSNRGLNGVVNFSEGIDVGYRWFDRQHIAPLFPFGFGLSYTAFYYSDLRVAPAPDGGLNVHFSVKNTGQMESDDVPQVYLGAPEVRPAHAAFAVHALAGFARIHVMPGEVLPVLVHILPRSLQYWSVDADSWERATGARDVLVGGSSRGLPLKQSVLIQHRK